MNFSKNQHILKKQDHLHNTRNLDAYILETPRRFKQKGQQHGEFIGPRIFNQLPYGIRSLKLLPRFKREVHKWLLNYGRETCKDLVYFYLSSWFVYYAMAVWLIYLSSTLNSFFTNYIVMSVIFSFSTCTALLFLLH